MNTQSQNVRKSIDRFADFRKRAEAEGLEVRPSVNGPYLFDPTTQRVVKRDWFNVVAINQANAVCGQTYITSGTLK